MASTRYPKFVRFADSQHMCAMRYQGHAMYYRDAGEWALKASWRNAGKELIVSFQNGSMLGHLKGKLLVACSEEEWRKDNRCAANNWMGPGHYEKAHN